MKLTPVLYRYNILRWVKFNWFVKGKLKVIPTTTIDVLKSEGYDVVDIEDVVYPNKKKIDKPEPSIKIKIDRRSSEEEKNHLDYKTVPCYLYKDEDLLLDGLEQAKVLTNTVEISNGLPEIFVESEKKLTLPDEIHNEVKKKVMLSCLLEATQEKLPKLKDPLRPAWVFPRVFGIHDKRKNELLCRNLLTICETLKSNVEDKSVVSDAFFSAPFEAHGKKIQFELTSELVVTSKKKLSPIADPNSTNDITLPDIHPVHCTVSMRPYHFYEIQNIYPFGIKSKWPNVHLAFTYFNETEVKNIFEEEVTETQFQGRTLLKGFTSAAAKAQAIYGNDVKTLDEPIVVPVVQTDGKRFHFTVLQLNTLELDKNVNVKNIFWQTPVIPLYGCCEYIRGKPTLENYNPDVIKKLVAFYNVE